LHLPHATPSAIDTKCNYRMYTFVPPIGATPVTV
jgi:hypothetical protein